MIFFESQQSECIYVATPINYLLNSWIEMGALNSTFFRQLAAFTLSSIPLNCFKYWSYIEVVNAITNPLRPRRPLRNSPLRCASLSTSNWSFKLIFFLVKGLHDVFDSYSFSSSCSYQRASRERATTAVFQLRVQFLLSGFQIPSGWCKFLCGKLKHRVDTFSNPSWLFLVSSTPKIFIIRDAAISHTHTDLSIHNLKKLKKFLDMALCKTTTMHPHNFSVPDPLSHLLSYLLSFRATTGRAKHLQTYTKLDEVDILVQVTYLKQRKYNLPSEINR